MDDGHMDGQHCIRCQEALKKYYAKDTVEKDIILMVGTWYKVNLRKHIKVEHVDRPSNILEDKSDLLARLYLTMHGVPVVSL